jgi:hypothetical protein
MLEWEMYHALKLLLLLLLFETFCWQARGFSC